MKIRFTKNITVDVMEPWTGTNDTVDKLFRSGLVIEVGELVPVSDRFTTIWTAKGDCLIDIRNDSFEVIES